MLAIFTQTNNGSCTATPFHTVRNTRSTMKLFVWSGVDDGALLCGRPRRLAPVDSRVPYTVTTSRSTSGQHTAAPKRNIFSERYDFANKLLPSSD